MTNSIYISGGITGVTDFENLFQKAEDQLVSVGYAVVNPVKILPPEDDRCGCTIISGDHTWLCYMRYDIAEMMLSCDKIALLPNWYASKGAQAELTLASNLGFQIGTVEQWIERAK